MGPAESGSFLRSLRSLAAHGVRFATVIDVGCADGNYFLSLVTAGLAEGAVPLNIDPNPVYEQSLRAIHDVLGGHYRICAIANCEGDVELTTSAHPYWSSLRPKGDVYWERINNLAQDTIIVPATTLDRLREEINLKPPFLLKLDVPGAETAVLNGASRTLKDTNIVICETDMDDFEAINATLIAHDFVLYDLTRLNYLSDGRLGWFYPVYVRRELAAAKPAPFWEAAQNEAVIQSQVERREAVLKWNAQILESIRRSMEPAAADAAPEPAPALAVNAPISRNAPCPCGSGLKYKHCCGAYSR